MSTRIFNWTNKTSTGLIDDELDHIWADIGDALVEGEGINIVGNVISAEDAAPANKGILQLANDLGGSAASPVVIGIRNQNVLPTPPSSGDILRFDGTDWTIVQERGLVFHPGWMQVGGAAVLQVSMSNSRINLADDATRDSFAIATFRVPEGWENRDLTFEARINFTSTEDYRLEWDLNDGSAGARSALTHTGAGNEVLTLSTTTQLAANNAGRMAHVILLRNPQHADDTNNNTALVFFLRVYLT